MLQLLAQGHSGIPYNIVPECQAEVLQAAPRLVKLSLVFSDERLLHTMAQ